MNTELRDAIEALEKEKVISSEILFEAIETALIQACKSHYGSTENITVGVDRENYTFFCIAEKTVVETEDDFMDPLLEISLEDARAIDRDVQIGDTVKVDINSKSFGRIATQNAKNVILQRIREEERSVIFKYFFEKQREVMTGVVTRKSGRNYRINLGRAEGILTEKEQVKGRELAPNTRLRVYILEVTEGKSRLPRILVSRTHPELVRRLFEQEVAEIRDGIVEIRSIAREAGSRTKIAVWSNDPNVDPVGACVGVNGTRVGNIVRELDDEKIDIVCWDENPGNLIRNALSPAKIVTVFADPEEKTAKVVVPDYQLSLAIGREGQNARLAARLTGYKIDIKSETQAKDAFGFRYEDYVYDEDEEDYEDEEYEEGYEDGEYEEEPAEGYEDTEEDPAAEDADGQDEA